MQYSRKQLIEIYKQQEKAQKLSFSTFYNRVHSMGWSIEKALSFPVKALKLRYRNPDVFLEEYIKR